MSTIELYAEESEAVDARDYYNHELSQRAVVVRIPDTDVINYGGGPKERIFNEPLEPACWILIVEN